VKCQYLKENLAAAHIELTAAELEAVREVAAKADTASGPRYPPEIMETMFVETPAL